MSVIQLSVKAWDFDGTDSIIDKSKQAVFMPWLEQMKIIMHYRIFKQIVKKEIREISQN